MADKDLMVDLYGASYGGFARDVYAEVRREAWGEEIGQNSWLTRDELDARSRASTCTRTVSRTRPGWRVRRAWTRV